MNEQPDIHARLMSVYPQVPEWWYATIFGESRLRLWNRDDDLDDAVDYSVHVRVWCDLDRGVAHPTTGLGVRPRPRHR